MSKTALSKFSKFSAILDKNSGSKIRLRGFSNITEYIDTGNYLLNAQISGSLFGGYPNTRSFCLAGESGSGKTYLCLNAVRNAQLMDYFVIYIDTEGALDEADFMKFGCNMDQLNYKRIGLISECNIFMNEIMQLKEENPEVKVAVFIDSMGMLDTDKFKADLDKGKPKADMGLRAKELRAMFRAFTLDYSSLQIPLLMTNHISASVDAFSGDSMGGGKGLEYAASGILFLYKNAISEEQTPGQHVKTGTRVRSTVKKCRLAKPVNIKFHISFEKGMNRYVGLEDYIDWEKCGVVRGKKLTEKEYNKLKPEEQAKGLKFVVNEITGTTVKDTSEVTYYVIPSNSARNFVVKWTGDVVPTREFFSKKIFSDKVLSELEENVIKPTFKYASYEEIVKAEMEELEQLEVDEETE